MHKISYREGAIYQIIIVPQIPMMFTGNSSVSLTLLYNTDYNLSVEATLPCQHQAHGHILLFYGELIGMNIHIFRCHKM